jgi:hypothetical protein
VQKKYITYFPKPLLKDLIEGRWIPIVGSGLSRNAVVPQGATMPLWNDLGRTLAEEMPSYPYSGAIDAISAYSYEYSRAKLIERLSELLLVDKVLPGVVHEKFCSVPFNIVCTTNIDFLLERQYQVNSRYCRPVIDEDQLSIGLRNSDVTLLKLHGDLHHPQRLVVTEDDYDLFLTKYPLLATYIANLLIERTAVLIGYSLDDPDFRQIWQVIGERLGKLRRNAYSIMVDAQPIEIAKFERRGVKAINLPGDKSHYGDILATAFDEIRKYWTANIISTSQVTEEEPLRELTLPIGANTRLCYFAIPFSLHSFYKDRIFPETKRFGFVPFVADDIVSPGDNILAKIEALIARASIVVVDATDSSTAVREAQLALSTHEPSRVYVTADMETIGKLPDFLARRCFYIRPNLPFGDSEEFERDISKWFEKVAQDISPQLSEEPKRLLELREYRAAIISAMTLLEITLRKYVEQVSEKPGRPLDIIGMYEFIQCIKTIDSSTKKKIKNWIKVRNSVVHTQEPVNAKLAREIVNGVLRVVERMKVSA